MIGYVTLGTNRYLEAARSYLELGGEDEGAPGLRGEQFYAGYFRDLDGNKLNAFCMVTG